MEESTSKPAGRAPRGPTASWVAIDATGTDTRRRPRRPAAGWTGSKTNRALVAYVRHLSDEELADLLVSLDPKVYQDLLERALGQQPKKRPPRAKP